MFASAHAQLSAYAQSQVSHDHRSLIYETFHISLHVRSKVAFLSHRQGKIISFVEKIAQIYLIKIAVYRHNPKPSYRRGLSHAVQGPTFLPLPPSLPAVRHVSDHLKIENRVYISPFLKIIEWQFSLHLLIRWSYRFIQTTTLSKQKEASRAVVFPHLSSHNWLFVQLTA